MNEKKIKSLLFYYIKFNNKREKKTNSTIIKVNTYKALQ